MVISGVSLPFAVAYYGSRGDRRSGAILGTTLTYALCMGAVLVPLARLLEPHLADVFSRGHGGGAWVVAAVLVPLTFLDYTTQNQVLGQKRFGRYNAIIVSAKVVSLVGVVAFVRLAGLGVTGGLIALGVGSLTTIALSTPYIVAEGRPSVDGGLLRLMLSYGARVQVGAIFSTLNYRLDVVVLQFFRPLSEVGYYVIAQIIAELVTILSSGFAVSILPLVASAGEGEDSESLTVRSLRHHGILSIVAIVANAFFGTAVIWWAYGPSYHAAIVPMLILLPGMWFLGTGTVITGDLRGRARPGTASALSGLAVVVTVGLDLALIPPFGVTGAAVASVCAYTVFGVASLVVLGRVTSVELRTLLPSFDELRAYRQILRGLVDRRRAAAPPGTAAR